MKTQMWRRQARQAAVMAALFGGVLCAKAQAVVVTDKPVVVVTDPPVYDPLYDPGYDAPPQSPNRVWGGGRAMFNVKARFYHGASPSNPGDATSHGVNRSYDNGYVRVDDSGNAGDMTWNWGFADAPGQPPAVNGTTLELRSSSSPAQGTSSKTDDDPQFGFEVGYGRVLSRGDAGRGTEVTFGLEGSFNMTWLDIENRKSISGTSTTIVDEYDMSGLPIIPSSPFVGSSPTPGGPLPLLLPDAPFNRTTTTTPTTAIESGRIEGELYGFKVGPFAEIQLSRVIGLQLRGGLALVLADTEFSYTETITPGGSVSGSESDQDWLFGGFVELRVTFEVARNLNIYVSGGYQHVKDQKLSAGGQKVKLDLGDTLSAAAGVSFSF